MEYLRSVFGKKQIILAITGAASLLLAVIVTLICKGVVSKLDAENLATRWSKTGKFAQVSCFFSEMSGFEDTQIPELNYNIEQKLTLDSLITTNPNARTWVYAYSANGKAVVSSNLDTAEIKAVGVGGDYFLFHPLKLLAGNYFDGDSVMDDLVVLDRDAAAVLFGSYDVAGQIVEIGGHQHIVSGVVEREKGRINDLAGNNTATIYMSYNSLSKNGMASYLNMYEAMMPNPISGYAKGVLEEKIGVTEEAYELVENTGRFHWTKLVANVKNFGIRGMNGKAIVYPYWENVARGTEDYLTPVAVLGLLLYLYPIVLVILLLFRLWKKRTIHWRDVKGFLENRFEEYREKRRKIKKGEVYDEN